MSSLAELLHLKVPEHAQAAPSAFALWHLGFRPFYLLASIFASLSIALWGAQFAGWLSAPYLRGPLWHAHEMVFGCTLAVMTGFLFTAVRNWTNRSTPTGVALAALAALWLAGRVLVLTPYAVAAALINIAFPLAAALGIGMALAKSGNRHNFFFVVLLVAMAVAELATHLASLGLVQFSEWLGVQAALDIVLIVMTVLGGRVIPMFTRNSVRDANVRNNALLERVVPLSVVAVFFADLLPLPTRLAAVVLGIAAIAQAARFWLWSPWRTLRVPMVWILHVGYLWIVAHLALRALSAIDVVPAPLATHALTAGAIGALTLGMMTRTARGHTGRPIVADVYEIAAFVLVTTAAITRVLVPLAMPSTYRVAVIVSACLWSVAYAI
jgi:uncharacterized protein involved in response to NO